MSATAGGPGRPPVRMQKPAESMPALHVTGRSFSAHEDLYHFILTLSWLQFFGVVAVAFLALNALFALAYWIVPGTIANVSSFEDAFYFSVESLSTIGFGSMSPSTRYGHVLVSLEAFAGLLFSAMVTGLTFAKFARPTAKFLFSEKLVVTNRNGVPHLMLRVANWRHNQVAEATMRVVLLVSEKTLEGEEMRRSIDVQLVRPTTPLFLLTWTAMHRIDETSPFYGEGAVDRLRAQRAEIYVSLTGVDETIATTITARRRFTLDDVVWNARYADVINFGEDKVRRLDYSHFHDVVPVEPTSPTSEEER